MSGDRYGYDYQGEIPWLIGNGHPDVCLCPECAPYEYELHEHKTRVEGPVWVWIGYRHVSTNDHDDDCLCSECVCQCPKCALWRENGLPLEGEIICQLIRILDGEL